MIYHGKNRTTICYSDLKEQIDFLISDTNNRRIKFSIDKNDFIDFAKIIFQTNTPNNISNIEKEFLRGRR